MAAVIPLLQLLLGGEGAQAMIQVYGLHLLPPTYGNGLVIHPKLNRDKCYQTEITFEELLHTRSRVLW